MQHSVIHINGTERTMRTGSVQNLIMQSILLPVAHPGFVDEGPNNVFSDLARSPDQEDFLQTSNYNRMKLFYSSEKIHTQGR
jgi:hypothetical protein